MTIEQNDNQTTTTAAVMDAIVKAATEEHVLAHRRYSDLQAAYTVASTASLKVNDEAHLVRGKVPAELHARKTKAAALTVHARAAPTRPRKMRSSQTPRWLPQSVRTRGPGTALQ